jgi:hypothetical protein
LYFLNKRKHEEALAMEKKGGGSNAFVSELPEGTLTDLMRALKKSLNEA